ncbi:MAG TPA: alpha/beta hydrolase [Caulobacteraceae bacterium]|jgi:acetyl esterase/lipase|nr:alpha/beta hydrolase [Caulobacteraceae bacterium]
MTDTTGDDLDPAAFRAWLAASAGGPETLDEARARLDRVGLEIDVPEGCSVAQIQAGDVPAEGLTPASARDGRLLIFLHGGGYGLHSPRSMRHYAARLAQAAATSALVPDYRLAPEHPFPAAVEDAVTAYRWALDRLPAGRIALAGNSAGGGLALACVLSARAQGLPRPACLYLASPWADLAEGGPSYVAKAESDIFCTAPMLKMMAGEYLAGADARDPLASPLFGDAGELPPLLIHVGSEEILLSDSVSLAERAAHARVEVRLEVFPEMLHDFPVFHRQLAVGRRAIREAGAWLAERLDR